MAATSTAQPSSESNASRVIFCDHCGSIMDEPSYVGASVACRLCGTTVDASVFQALVLHSAGVERVVEPELGEEGGAQRQRQQARATVQEPCPKCNHHELSYYTMQLRSADEGQTVFYECAKCGHAFSTNT